MAHHIRVKCCAMDLVRRQTRRGMFMKVSGTLMLNRAKVK